MHAPSKRPLNVRVKVEELNRFSKHYRLTEREMDVFSLLASKVINSSELGKQLGVSHHTVSNHLKNIFHKTSTGNKAELLALFIGEILGTDVLNTSNGASTQVKAPVQELPLPAVQP